MEDVCPLGKAQWGEEYRKAVRLTCKGQTIKNNAKNYSQCTFIT